MCSWVLNAALWCLCSCALCSQGGGHSEEEMDGARRLDGFGPFLLVRVSAICVAWVHEQCARWSPEVWEDSGELMVRHLPAFTTQIRAISPHYCLYVA